MIEKLYIDNYKCFRNFEADFGDQHSLLLLGQNGTGKSALLDALILLQRIARGTGKTGILFDADNINAVAQSTDIAFRLFASVDGAKYSYQLTLDLPHGFSAWRIEKETVTRDGIPLLAREYASVKLANSAAFDLDWHQLALPVIFKSEKTVPILAFRNWLARMYLLKPVPSLMNDICREYPDYLDSDCANFPGYLMRLLGSDFSLFGDMRRYIS